MKLILPSKTFIAIVFSLVLAFVSTFVVVKNVAGVDIYPTTSPIAPTPTPSPGSGAYTVVLNPNVTSITCQLNDPNCYIQVVYRAINRTGKPLFDTTMYVSNYLNMLSYIGFDGQWTNGTSKTTRVVQPGEGAINTLVKVIPPNKIGKFSATLYIDGRVCNTNLTPWDCYYYGGTAVSFTIEVITNVTPTVTAAPTPTATPKPTVIPIPVNRAPIISPFINWFKIARVNVSYKGTVSADDPDRDTVTMKITGLPGELSYTCREVVKGKTVCAISGVARSPGTYRVMVTATDSRGAKTSKTYTFLVLGRNTRAIRNISLFSKIR